MRRPPSDYVITEVDACEVLDSRGRPTVFCEVVLQGGARGQAIAPSGISKSHHERHELRDGGSRYGGNGVRQAANNVRSVLGPAVIGSDARNQVLVDDMLTTTDGTSDLSRLGANAVLALSLAVGLAAAQADGLPMYRALSERFEREPLLPLPMVNILSGGAHAGGCLDFQDFLVVPVGASSFSEAIEWAAAVREATRREASSYGQLTALVADEGGLGLPMPTNRAALDLLCTGIEAAGLRVGSEVALALDVAANQFATSTGYSLLGEDRVLDAPALVEELVQWCHDYPLVSIEDPIADNDWDGWQIASSRLGGSVQLVGDDLFATDIVRLEQGIESGIANAVLVKVNQVGTLTGASDLLMRAQEAGLATVVSARSGETEDSWLADLAVGWAAGQIKVGSTTRGERTAKWNRLLQIEHALGTSVRYAGAEALRPTFRSSMTTSDQRDP